MTLALMRCDPRNTQYYVEDLMAALTAAGIPMTSPLRRRLADGLTHNLRCTPDYRAVYDTLTGIPDMTPHGEALLGLVTHFSLTVGSSLRLPCELIVKNLPELGLSPRDLQWPVDACRNPGDGVEWSKTRMLVFDRAVRRWRREHPMDPPSHDVTVTGHWQGENRIIITGIIDGVHDVYGGDDDSFTDHYTIPDGTTDETSLLHWLIAQEYGGRP